MIQTSKIELLIQLSYVNTVILKRKEKPLTSKFETVVSSGFFIWHLWSMDMDTGYTYNMKQKWDTANP